MRIGGDGTPGATAFAQETVECAVAPHEHGVDAPAIENGRPAAISVQNVAILAPHRHGVRIASAVHEQPRRYALGEKQAAPGEVLAENARWYARRREERARGSEGELRPPRRRRAPSKCD